MKTALDFLVGGLALISFAVFVFVNISRNYKNLEKTSASNFQLSSSGELKVDTPSGRIVFANSEKLTCQRSHYEDQLKAPSYDSRFKELFVSSGNKRAVLKFTSYEAAADFLKELERSHPETAGTGWADIE